MKKIFAVILMLCVTGYGLGEPVTYPVVVLKTELVTNQVPYHPYDIKREYGFDKDNHVVRVDDKHYDPWIVETRPQLATNYVIGFYASINQPVVLSTVTIPKPTSIQEIPLPLSLSVFPTPTNAAQQKALYEFLRPK